MDYFSTHRQPDDPWFRAGTVDVTTTVLVAALTTASMFVWAVNGALLDPLKLWSDEVRHGQVWRLLTWPLANGPSIYTVLSIAMFYLFGREIERLLGRARYLWFLGILTVVPGLVATAVGIDVAGLFALEFAVFLAFIAVYPTAMGFFRIPLWVFGVVFLAIEVLQLVGARQWDYLLVVLVSAGLALLVARSYGISELEWIPRIPLPGTAAPTRPRSRAARSPRRERGRREAEVVTLYPQQPTVRDLVHQADIDNLLDKIPAQGIDSLTPDERRRLDEHSRRLRDDK